MGSPPLEITPTWEHGPDPVKKDAQHFLALVLNPSVHCWPHLLPLLPSVYSLTWASSHLYPLYLELVVTFLFWSWLSHFLEFLPPTWGNLQYHSGHFSHPVGDPSSQCTFSQLILMGRTWNPFPSLPASPPPALPTNTTRIFVHLPSSLFFPLIRYISYSYYHGMHAALYSAFKNSI